MAPDDDRRPEMVMVRMPTALRDELKKTARDRDLTMSQAVRRAVRQWLEYGDIGLATVTSEGGGAA